MHIASISLIAALALAPAAFADEAPSALLEKGIFQQETTGNLDAAEKIYRQIVDEANANRRFVAEAQYRLGLCYQRQGKKAEAQAAFRELVATYADQTELVAKARAQIGATKATVADADKKSAENLTAEGWRLWGERKLTEAEEKFREAVEKDPDNANAWNGLGWTQLNQGKPVNAKDSFEKCVALEPKAAAALNGLGWIAKGAGKTDEAIGWWKKAIEAAPNATAALSGLASTCMELNQYEQAAQYYQMWLKAEPGNADARAGLDNAKAADENVKAATPAAEQWLGALDAGKYADCWAQSAERMRKTMSQMNFEAAMKGVLSPFGKVVSRNILSAAYATSVPGAPDGNYVIIQYQTDFENKKGAVETITPMKDVEGKWRVSGYYVK